MVSVKQFCIKCLKDPVQVSLRFFSPICILGINYTQQMLLPWGAYNPFKVYQSLIICSFALLISVFHPFSHSKNIYWMFALIQALCLALVTRRVKTLCLISMSSALVEKQSLLALSDLVCVFSEVWCDCRRLLEEKKCLTPTEKASWRLGWTLKNGLKFSRQRTRKDISSRGSKMCRGRVKRGRDVVGDWWTEW